MSFEEFQHHARLYVVEALDDSELAAFEEARAYYGAAAEAYIDECRKLNAAFALSLSPNPPARGAKQRLMSLIRTSLKKRPDSTSYR